MEPYLQDSDFTLWNGDALEVLRQLPDESVHCCVTSPPYWGLRDYGTGSWEGGDAECDHRSREPKRDATVTLAGTSNSEGYALDTFRDLCGKCGARRVDQQLGLEATPDEYVAQMVAVFREVRRVLRRDGTCWLNLGDSYNAGTTARRKGSPAVDHGYWENGGTMGDERLNFPGLKPKDLCGLPWRVAFALQADGWYLRSDIIWAKPNPMPESVTDRPTKAHEYVFLLSRSPRYFFDQEAVREPVSPFSDFSRPRPNGPTPYSLNRGPNRQDTTEALGNGSRGDPSGRNIRSVWEISTQPYPEAHFATFPEALVERCIKAGTSERGVCPECGAPWVREVERTLTNTEGWAKATKDHHRDIQGSDAIARNGQGRAGDSVTKTLGWKPSCGCFVPGASGSPLTIPATVLDPFIGSGTTALVARRLGRKTIGIELNPEYCELAARRLQQLSLLA